MNKIFLDDKTTITGTPLVATIGFFDGVHLGHQHLIEQVIAEARRDGMESAVITFDAHPRQVLQQDYQPKLLSTLDEKLILLSRTGIDNVIVLHFDREMSALSAREFMKGILFTRLNVRKLVIGYDNRFGHNRAEGFNDYVLIGKELGMEVLQADALTIDGVNVSSSYIRKLIGNGEIELANQLLGYAYTIYGTVVSGFQEGRRLGFPTANLDATASGQLVPSDGVYAAKARLAQSMETKHAMMNIGTRPTFGGTATTLEAYIFNFSEDIYGKTLLISFVHRIRDEHKFDNADDLAEQLRKDAQTVEEQFKKDEESENEE